jgi:hypothetical protein
LQLVPKLDLIVRNMTLKITHRGGKDSDNPQDFSASFREETPEGKNAPGAEVTFGRLTELTEDGRPVFAQGPRGGDATRVYSRGEDGSEVFLDLKKGTAELAVPGERNRQPISLEEAEARIKAHLTAFFEKHEELKSALQAHHVSTKPHTELQENLDKQGVTRQLFEGKALTEALGWSAQPGQPAQLVVDDGRTAPPKDGEVKVTTQVVHSGGQEKTVTTVAINPGIQHFAAHHNQGAIVLESDGQHPPTVKEISINNRPVPLSEGAQALDQTFGPLRDQIREALGNVTLPGEQGQHVPAGDSPTSQTVSGGKPPVQRSGPQ